MLFRHYPKISPVTKQKSDRQIPRAATRPRHYRFCHAPPPPPPLTFLQPVSTTTSYCRPSDSWISRTRPFEWSSPLRVRSYSTGIPCAPDDFDALIDEPPSWDSLSTLSYSSDTHGLQGEPAAQESRSCNRFDWKLRASSRVQKKDGEDNAETQKPIRRKRLKDPEPDLAGPFYEAFQDYKTRFSNLLRLEEAEEAAALKHRLSTWGIQRLEREGYCMTALYACWLEENQFGKPVASFSLGPGIVLPDSKLETGTQVLLSRLDPLKEAPEVGSIIRRKDSAFHISFPSHFDLSGSWRVDLGVPNLMYERMRTAISFLAYDPSVFEQASSASEEFILQGTGLRDVLLRSFQPQSSGQESDATSESLGPPAVDLSPVVNFSSGDKGAFRDDQRIVSWSERYTKPNPIKMDSDPPINLNESQMQAMAAMVGRRISLIQGPPGTGKTKTIIETIKLLKVHFEVPQPLLVCTYTNAAVDNLVEGLAKVGVKPLRFGSQGNIRPSLLPHSLEYKMQMHPLYKTFTKVTKEIEDLIKDIRKLAARYAEYLRKLKDLQRPPTKTRMTRADNMFKDLEMKKIRLKGIQRKRYAVEQQMLREVVAEADVICTTCLTAACSALSIVDFPVVFLDEASMSTEPASLIPIMKGSQHLALIGDHKQLPPVIISREAKEGGLSVSLFERLTEEGHVHSVMLDTQYRMHPDIAKFPSKEFYNLALLNGTVDDMGIVLPGLEPPRSTLLKVKNRPSVIFVDHGGNESMKGRSRVNITEAHLVASLVEDLLLANEDLQGRDIGVIAPYAAQITLLVRYLNSEPKYLERFKSVLGVQRAMQMPHIEVKTVDGFEGREKEVIIFSTVRNNQAGHIGFLADKKRLNVGLTRAKRGLFVLGSISTLRAGKPEYADGVSKVGEKKQRGHESWHRYAQFMLDGKRVVSLEGSKLTQVLSGHWDALQKESMAETLAEVYRLERPNQRPHHQQMVLRG